MPNLLSARDKLVDVLIRTMGTTVDLATICEGIKYDQVGRDALSALSLGGALKIDLSRLITALGEYKDGLSIFKTVLEPHLKRKIDWPAVQDSLTIYSSILAQTRVSDVFREAEEIDKQRLLKKLNTIANTYPDCQADRLQEALRLAFLQRFPDRPSGLSAEIFPEHFSHEPISGWPDLLARAQRINLLDDALLACFEDNLKVAHSEKQKSGEICSLVVMLLRPRTLPHDLPCTSFDYRAYFCQGEQAPPEQWIPIKVTDQRIGKGKHPGNGEDKASDSWWEEWQSVVQACIKGARQLRPSKHSQLMLEIFLPAQLLNEDIGMRLTVPQPLGAAEPLHAQYRFVLRSSERFQSFWEGEQDLYDDFPLYGKWQQVNQRDSLQSPPCYWYHDTTLSGREDPSKEMVDLDQFFRRLRSRSEYFAMKRLANLPACPDQRQQWIERLLMACPAIALWWRPTAESSFQQRHDSFTFSCRDSDANPFGAGQPSADHPPRTDSFSHPAANNPLRLFFALASTVFHGQLEEEERAQPFREMVLLVDSPDRWPPPVDASFSRRESGEDGGAVTVFSEEACLPPS
jgi:hypothetical protein